MSRGGGISNRSEVQVDSREDSTYSLSRHSSVWGHRPDEAAREFIESIANMSMQDISLTLVGTATEALEGLIQECNAT